MDETISTDLRPRKDSLLRIGNSNESATIRGVRDPQNPVKLRAEYRARELGTTLQETYRRAGVSRNYLTYAPKSGWREDRLRSVATALQWTVDDLLLGPERTETGRIATAQAQEAAQEREAREAHLLEVAIRISVSLLSETSGANNTPNVGRLSRLIYQTLRALHVGEEPSEHALGVWGRALLAALSARSTDS